MTVDTEIRALAAPEQDQVSGGLLLALVVMTGGVAAGIGAVLLAGHCGAFDSVAVRDGVVYVGGVPQN